MGSDLFVDSRRSHSGSGSGGFFQQQHLAFYLMGQHLLYNHAYHPCDSECMIDLEGGIVCEHLLALCGGGDSFYHVHVVLLLKHICDDNQVLCRVFHNDDEWVVVDKPYNDHHMRGDVLDGVVHVDLEEGDDDEEEEQNDLLLVVMSPVDHHDKRVVVQHDGSPRNNHKVVVGYDDQTEVAHKHGGDGGNAHHYYRQDEGGVHEDDTHDGSHDGHGDHPEGIHDGGHQS